MPERDTEAPGSPETCPESRAMTGFGPRQTHANVRCAAAQTQTPGSSPGARVSKRTARILSRQLPTACQCSQSAETGKEERKSGGERDGPGHSGRDVRAQQ